MSTPYGIDPDEAIRSHTYEYIFTDLRTHLIVGELPLTSVRYQNKVSRVGEFSGSIVVNEETNRHNLRTITSPGKTGLYILRDGIVVWGGIIWKRAYDSTSREIRLTGQTFESYFYKRFQGFTKYWSRTDQFDIARWLVTSNGSAADLDIEVDQSTSPVYRERTMFGYEFKSTGEELEQLGNLLNGFDWNVQIYRGDNSEFKRRLTFAYPYAGVSQEQTRFMFEYPGSVSRVSFDEDAQSSGNSIYAIGVGEGTEQLTANARVDSQLQQGWPLLELSRSYKSVVRLSTLLSHAERDRDKLGTPITVFEVEVDPNLEPQFGTYMVGDWARFRFENDFFTPRFDTYARITEISVNVENNTGRESVTLTLGSDEVRAEENVEL